MVESGPLECGRAASCGLDHVPVSVDWWWCARGGRGRRTRGGGRRGARSSPPDSPSLEAGTRTRERSATSSASLRPADVERKCRPFGFTAPEPSSSTVAHCTPTDRRPLTASSLSGAGFPPPSRRMKRPFKNLKFIRHTIGIKVYRRDRARRLLYRDRSHSATCKRRSGADERNT